MATVVAPQSRVGHAPRSRPLERARGVITAYFLCHGHSNDPRCRYRCHATDIPASSNLGGLGGLDAPPGPREAEMSCPNRADAGVPRLGALCEVRGAGVLQQNRGRLFMAGACGTAVMVQAHQLAVDHDATPSQLALAWLLRRSAVIVPILGTSRVSHLEQNLAAAHVELTDAEFDAISIAAAS